MSIGASSVSLSVTDRSGLRQAVFPLDQGIGVVTESVGAVIVVAETFILFAGVVSRYVFDSPLIWTDELANFLFLWLSMLGTVVALRADSHMRLTTFVAWVRLNPGRWFSGRAGGHHLRAADPYANTNLPRWATIH